MTDPCAPAQAVKELAFTEIGWHPEEVEKLAASLPYATALQRLKLHGNHVGARCTQHAQNCLTGIQM